SGNSISLLLGLQTLPRAAERVGRGLDLGQGVVADLPRRRALPPALARREPRVQEVPDPVAASRAVSQPGRRGCDAAVPALGTGPQVLAPGQLPPLGPGLPVHL